MIGRNLLFVSLLLMCANAYGALGVTGLRVMTQKNPQGIDDTEPCFSWKLESDERSVLQTSYRIVVTEGASDGSVVWDSGVIESSISRSSKSIRCRASMVRSGMRIRSFQWMFR